MKKGQLAIFVLLGIVVLISIALLLTMQPSGQAPVLPTQLQASARSLEACFKTAAQSMLELQMSRGGLVAPTHAVSAPPVVVQLVADETGVWTPALEDMEADLSWAISEAIKECPAQVRASVPGASIGTDVTPSVRTVYADNGVTVIINYPLTLTAGDVKEAMYGVSFTLKTDVIRLHDAASSIASQVSAYGAIPIDDLSKIDADISMMSVGYGWTFISLNKNGAVYNIAVRERTRVINQQITILLPSRIVMAAGTAAVREIGNEGTTYVTNLPWARVEHGRLILNTANVDPGEYMLRIVATDIMGHEDDAVSRILVTV
jgi:hypothetical protein